MANDERKPLPTVILVVLTLLGLYSIPRVGSYGPGESARTASEKGEGKDETKWW